MSDKALGAILKHIEAFGKEVTVERDTLKEALRLACDHVSTLDSLMGCSVDCTDKCGTCFMNHYIEQAKKSGISAAKDNKIQRY